VPGINAAANGAGIEAATTRQELCPESTPAPNGAGIEAATTRQGTVPGINAAANGAGIEAATTRQGTVPGINAGRERCRNRGGDDAPRNCARNQRRPRTVPGSRRHAVLVLGTVLRHTHRRPIPSQSVARRVEATLARRR